MLNSSIKVYCTGRQGKRQGLMHRTTRNPSRCTALAGTAAKPGSTESRTNAHFPNVQGVKPISELSRMLDSTIKVYCTDRQRKHRDSLQRTTANIKV